MGLRFQKRMTIFPGLSINFGKRGASLSMGPRGCKTTISSRGVKHSYGIPGTGIRYETPYRKWEWGKTRNQPDNGAYNPQPVPQSCEPMRVSLWTRICDMLGF